MREQVPEQQEGTQPDVCQGVQPGCVPGSCEEARQGAFRTLGVVAAVLVVAAAFQAAVWPAEVTAAVAVVVVLAFLGLHVRSRVVRTQAGLAVVRDRRMHGERVRVLAQGGVYQSATYVGERRFEPVFAYQRAFETMFEAEGAFRAVRGHGIRRVLAIGGGGYAWPKYALTQHAELAMDVVEIDPAVTEVARRWFYLGEVEALAGERLRLITAEGRAYLGEAADRVARGEAEPYDAIVNDTFVGHEPVRALATVEAARAAKAYLAPGGLYLTNVVSAGDGGDLAFLRDEVATLSQVFACVSVIPATDEAWGGEDNYLVIASDADYAFAGAIPYDTDFLGEPLRD